MAQLVSADFTSSSLICCTSWWANIIAIFCALLLLERMVATFVAGDGKVRFVNKDVDGLLLVVG